MHNFQSFDMNCGETATVEWRNKKKTTVTLHKISERRDAIRHAVRSARADIEINGQKMSLTVGNYRLPQKLGCIWIDCPVTSGFRKALPVKRLYPYDDNANFAGVKEWQTLEEQIEVLKSKNCNCDI